jgi:hypothetical protein
LVDELFQETTPAPRKPFSEYLRQTPATPLSAATKLFLWTASVLVTALLVAALVSCHATAPSHAGPKKDSPQSPGESTKATEV